MLWLILSLILVLVIEAAAKRDHEEATRSKDSDAVD